MSNRDTTRRSFLGSCVGATVAGPWVISRTALAAPGRPGANDRIRLGFIGAGGRARQLINESPLDFELVAVADCYLPTAHSFLDFTKEARADLCPDPARVKPYQDYRQMLDKEKLDAVFVPTTTHARVLCCINALAAGLDVYSEKPMTLTVQEGHALTKAVRKFDRILQVGTQHRSLEINRWACELVRSGKIGKVEKVVCMNYEGPKTWQQKPTQPIPEGLDWDHWCNQADLRPYHDELGGRGALNLNECWHLWRAYDGGGHSWGMTGWGTHALDQVQWALGMDHTSPVEAWPTETDSANSPITVRYANGIPVEMKLPLRTDRGPGLGGIFIGSEAKIEINRNKVVSNPPALTADAPDPAIRAQDYKTSLAEAHIKNWVECMRTRREPNCPVEVGHRQTIICHLANIARDLGRRVRFDPQTDQFVDDDEANAHPSMSRPRRRGYQLPELG